MRKKTIARGACVLLLLAAAGCSERTSARCSAGNCAGCCMGEVCVGGDKDDACGAGGGACSDCGASLKVCAAGQCAPRCASGCDGSADFAVADLATVDFATAELGPPPPRWVFVTAESWNGDLVTAAMGGSGLASADKLCTASAVLGNLGGTWHAWLSDGTTDAINHVVGTGPWFLVGGGQVFADHASLGGAPAIAINHTQHGQPLAGDAYVWTATSGGKFDGLDCYEWTSPKFGDFGNVGNANGVNDWTASNGVYCNEAHHLYCFEQ